MQKFSKDFFLRVGDGIPDEGRQRGWQDWIGSKKLELSTVIHREEEYGKISYCPFIVILPMIA
jgi:hypothetical protein